MYEVEDLIEILYELSPCFKNKEKISTKVENFICGKWNTEDYRNLLDHYAECLNLLFEGKAKNKSILEKYDALKAEHDRFLSLYRTQKEELKKYKQDFHFIKEEFNEYVYKIEGL